MTCSCDVGTTENKHRPAVKKLRFWAKSAEMQLKISEYKNILKTNHEIISLSHS
jgi:hypothetical protein